MKKITALLVALLLVLAPVGELPLAGFGTVCAEAASEIALNKDTLTLVTKKTFLLTLSTDKAVTWSSADKSIATVSQEGLVTAIKSGKTTITAKSNGKTYSCALSVANTTTKAFKPGYTITKTDTKIENDRFIVNIPAGVYVPKTLEKDINAIMDAIEKTTGLSFYPDYLETSMAYFAEKRVTISIEKSAIGQEYDASYAVGATEVVVSPGDLLVNAGEGLALTHELLHIINARNGNQLSSALCEGFSTYFVSRIEDANYYPMHFDSYFNYSGYNKDITSKTAEKLFQELDSDGWEAYLYGFRLMHYIIESYGTDEYIEFCKKLDGDNCLYTNTEMAVELKKHYGNDFFVKFSKWYGKNAEQFTENNIMTDFSAFSRINFFPYYGSFNMYESHWFTYSDYVLFDFSSGFDYLKKYKGETLTNSITLTMCAEGNTTARFYNAEGKLLKKVKLSDTEKTVTVKNAATIKISGDGKPVYFAPSFDDMVK